MIQDMDNVIRCIMKSNDGITLDMILLFLTFCKECANFKARKATTGIVVKAILSEYFDSRMQIDLIDMQSL